jgi:hypothetical protein
MLQDAAVRRAAVADEGATADHGLRDELTKGLVQCRREQKPLDPALLQGVSPTSLDALTRLVQDALELGNEDLLAALPSAILASKSSVRARDAAGPALCQASAFAKVAIEAEHAARVTDAGAAKQIAVAAAAADESDRSFRALVTATLGADTAATVARDADDAEGNRRRGEQVGGDEDLDDATDSDYEDHDEDEAEVQADAEAKAEAEDAHNAGDDPHGNPHHVALHAAIAAVAAANDYRAAAEDASTQAASVPDLIDAAIQGAMPAEQAWTALIAAGTATELFRKTEVQAKHQLQRALAIRQALAEPPPHGAVQVQAQAPPPHAGDAVAVPRKLPKLRQKHRLARCAARSLLTLKRTLAVVRHEYIGLHSSEATAGL